MYRLADECSNKAEQLAIVKALEKLRDFRHLQELQSSAALHTDSKITLTATANPRNHQHSVEQIRGVRSLEKDNWSIHFIWVKARNDNLGNELADQLAKNAASTRDRKTAYSRIPKSAVKEVIQEKGGNKNGIFQPKGKQQNHFFPT